MYLKSTIALGLMAMGIPAQATQIFRNTGTRGGWDFINEEHKGTVQEVTNVVYEGGTALKMTQIYDPSWKSRYHSEVVKNNIYKLGDTGFYGFAFRLSDTWQFSPEQNYNIAQFIADFTDLPGNCDDWMPSTMVWLVGNRLSTRVKQGTLCNQNILPWNDVATVSAGVWHKIVIQASWKNDGTGFFKMWFDGQKVVQELDITTTIEQTRYFQLRVGLYANGWYDDGGMEGTQGTRQIWYDELAAGTTFADADPGQW